MFWVSGTIFGGRDTRFKVSWPTSKVVVFWPFSWALAHCFGCRGRVSGPMTPGSRLQGRRQNLSFSHFWLFSWAITHCFGCRGRFSGPVTPSTRIEGDVKTGRFRVFWPFSWAIAHCFVFQGQFSGPVTPGTRFQGQRQNSSFVRFSAVFEGYSTLFWLLGTIFVARDPRYRVSGATPKHVVFWPFSCAIAMF